MIMFGEQNNRLTMKKLLLILLFLPLLFITCSKEVIEGCTDSLASNYDPLATVDDNSCTRCTECTFSWETLNGYDASTLHDAAALMGYADWDAYMTSLYPPSQEFCDETLDFAEAYSEETDLDADGTMDYRVLYNCE